MNIILSIITLGTCSTIPRQDLTSAPPEDLQKEGVFTLPCVNIFGRLGVGS